jgi:NADH:ubiquinone oxidoreductase subunit 6 (subunit J)
MYSETENILNGKKKEKFRQRAIALRRVSVVLSLCGIIMLGIAGLLWRDKKAVAHSVNTLTQANMTVIQSNYLSMFILGLGGQLLLLAMIGCCTSRRLENNN